MNENELELLYFALYENRSFSSAIMEEQNSGFHTEQSIVESIKQASAVKRVLRSPKFQQEVERLHLIESAELYAEIYAEDEELQELTDTVLADWPE